MIPVELEIKTFKDEKMTAVIELEEGTTLKMAIDVARELLTKSMHWKQVRVGMGSCWSKWIQPKTQQTQH